MINLNQSNMKIYTKKGDSGFTSLFDCTRISKSSELIDLIGDLDELNSFIGVINNPQILPDIQIWIFDLSTIIANPKNKYSFDEDLTNIIFMENEIDKLTALLPKLSNFILPSGNIHIARAISRRCERKLVSIIDKYTHIPKNCLIFLNRLSDYLFTLARFDNINNEVIYRKSSILSIIKSDDE
jgi:cob(I)alamin adenosyltransferase